MHGIGIGIVELSGKIVCTAKHISYIRTDSICYVLGEFVKL